MLDCVIIGGGPAGLNAALVMGRAGRKAILFDEDKPRNRVTQESHGFITQDGVKPSEFKKRARTDVQKYPSVSIKEERVEIIEKSGGVFRIQTKGGTDYVAKKVLLATGLRDVLPEISGIQNVYGTSVFSCPFCDGWEMRGQALAVIAENERAFHMGKLLSNWSRDVVVFTNGYQVLGEEEKDVLMRQHVTVVEEKIEGLKSKEGQLTSIRLQNGQEIQREAGIVMTDLVQSAPFAEQLGCEITPNGGIKVDSFGRTTVEGVYACGDTSLSTPSQLVIAAAEGNKAAAGVIMDLVEAAFLLP
ncbi:NAD(P)/FAD-dependent oxidoreductase [Domibacillus aminovorans]|uniref:Pyridine nucleotide-disulfide oxidoreductase n=1 Tax=Domibacillus aminovorans TaxID=29332 RepID=A0A177LBM2_9BACI|nr:NAD(P)/FAD-dependent oxidoreductase [Domibacillus aminovorans]OAH61991.1 pyridine nucleotide-disulfide oxidoreductase [Domibacillus aminovorans]